MIGWDGYFFAATREPDAVDPEWGRDHLERMHSIILGSGDLEEIHDADHRHGPAIPHVHGTFVEQAIQLSSYSRDVKDALLALIAALDEHERHAPESRR